MDTRTLRKNRLPAGRKTRCWVTLSGTPSLYQTIVGSGMPSALQFIVTGSLRGTVKSSGCSVIFGTWKAAKKGKEWKRISWVRSLFRFCYILRFLPFFRNLVSNLIKLKVLFSVFQRFFSSPLSIHAAPQSNYGFSASSVAKPTKHQMALNIKKWLSASAASVAERKKRKLFKSIVKQDNIWR